MKALLTKILKGSLSLIVRRERRLFTFLIGKISSNGIIWAIGEVWARAAKHIQRCHFRYHLASQRRLVQAEVMSPVTIDWQRGDAGP